MKRTPIEFNYSLYLSGKYDLETRGGSPVIIAGAIQDEKGLVVLGKCHSALMQWNDNGKYPYDNMERFDLVLYAKPITKYVNVILSKAGNVSASVTDHKDTYAKAGNKTLAQFEVQVPLDELAF